jgi:hypothetical protein
MAGSNTGAGIGRLVGAFGVVGFVVAFFVAFVAFVVFVFVVTLAGGAFFVAIRRQ